MPIRSCVVAITPNDNRTPPLALSNHLGSARFGPSELDQTRLCPVYFIPVLFIPLDKNDAFPF